MKKIINEAKIPFAVFVIVGTIFDLLANTELFSFYFIGFAIEIAAIFYFAQKIGNDESVLNCSIYSIFFAILAVLANAAIYSVFLLLFGVMIDVVIEKLIQNVILAVSLFAIIGLVIGAIGSFLRKTVLKY
ncbi:hypothetical protein KKE92_02725 [Candidatus Micrarchaeota archaeon]|nr:hypothetical protein [Candidatus Micrarchaeota archaeon]MBU1681691.1 hypothetical protein [Candidatus Micrarchaeota archaeon]